VSEPIVHNLVSPDVAQYWVKQGEQKATERIIKLLENRFAENVDHCEWGTHLFLDNAIALIKGASK
jgi:hypothetical protein